MSDDTTDDTKEAQFGGWASIALSATGIVDADSKVQDLDKLGRELLAERIDEIPEDELRYRLKLDIEHRNTRFTDD